jgi:hypothetical protein
MGPTNNVVPGALVSIESIRVGRRDMKFAGSRGGSVRERLTPGITSGGALSPAFFFVATPKGDVNEGVREGRGECFRGETGVIYRAANA